jgi:two-component system osmolarity sensor histidine kinase EnvZ
MDRLIGNVLDLARGLASESSGDVDLRGLLQELAGNDGRVTVASPELRLRTAPLALRRAVGNLVDNARRYGGEAPIDLVAEEWAGQVRIGVLDRGPGIPEEHLAAVFEPFHRVDAARNPAIGGAGLGLAIVRQLADANHWRIELKPRAGGGVEAWLTLDAPASRPPQDP